MRSTTVIWKVTLCKRKATMGQPKPQAHLEVVRPTDTDSSRYIPAVVARQLGVEVEHQSPSLEALTEEIEERSYVAARERINQLCRVRERSEYELSERLLAEGFSQTSVTRALARSVEVGIVSDQRFAASYIQSKLASGWGMRRIEHALSRHEIAITELPGWPEEYIQEEDELVRAVRAAQKRSMAKRLNVSSTMRFLASRGFSYAVARNAALQVAQQARLERDR